MRDINENLTTTQKAGIENQDVTKNVIDVEILESETPSVPEQPEPTTPVATMTNVDVFAETAQARQEEAKARSERVRQIEDRQSEQEAMARALGDQTLGQAKVEAQAMADAGISDRQSEIDSLDQSILAQTKALKQAFVQDNLDIQKLAGQGRGIPTQVVRGRQALMQAERNALRQTQAIELENQIATSNLLQGKVDDAKKAIQRATELQFKDKKTELALEMEWLGRTDKKLSDAKAAELKAIEKVEKERDTIFEIAVQAMKGGAGANEVQAIINAKSRDGAIASAKSLGAVARSQLATQALQRSQISANIQKIRAQAKMENIELPDLTEGARKDLDSAFMFKRTASRMKEILANGKSPSELMVGQDEISKEFRSIKTDLVDILARDRTGAVVGSDEKKDFERILGVGFLRSITSNSDELIKALDRSTERSNITLDTIDPTGTWDSFLTEKYPTQGYIEQQKATEALDIQDSSTIVPGTQEATQFISNVLDF